MHLLRYPFIAFGFYAVAEVISVFTGRATLPLWASALKILFFGGSAFLMLRDLPGLGESDSVTTLQLHSRETPKRS